MGIIRNYEAFPYDQDTYEEVLSRIQKKDGYTQVKPYAGMLFDQWVVS